MNYKQEVLKMFPNVLVINESTHFATPNSIYIDYGYKVSSKFDLEDLAWKDFYQKFCKQECTKPCGMNYCDENGCIDRKRVLTEPIEPMPELTIKDLDFYKKNAEEDYNKVPISVLKYITQLEKYISI